MSCFRAWQVPAFGAALELAQKERQPLADNEVRILMRAFSLNYRDLLLAKGLYNPRQALPFVPLSDGVGEVVEVGTNVRQHQVGDRVMTAFAPYWRSGEPSKRALRDALGGPIPGVLSEEVVLPGASVVAAPTSLSDAEAATLPCAAVTAWNALKSASLLPGDVVVTQGTGGVSLFALQLGKTFGARVVITSSSDEKLERTASMGAFRTWNYQANPKWSESVRDVDGAKLVVELGGAETMRESLRAVQPGGTIAVIGNLSGNEATLFLPSLLMNRVHMRGIMVGSVQDLREVATAVETHQIKPVIDREFSFEDANEALGHLEARKHFGKICLNVE